MHQTRQQVIMKVPIPRKGTKYVVRPTINVENSVPVLIAIRDMLKLAKTTREVQQMIHQKLLKINGRDVKDYHDSIQLFSILDADKPYVLTLLPTGRFTFKEAKNKSDRLCKVMNKTLLKNNSIQLNFHDGTNVVTKEKINVGDSVYLDASNKIKSHIPLQKGKSCFIIIGKYAGSDATVESVEGKLVTVKIKGLDHSPTLDRKGVVVL